MYRYLWEAHYDDGTVVPRFTSEGVENAPDPWRTRQFHLYSLINPAYDPVSLFIPKGAYFTLLKRRILPDQNIYIAGWQLPDDERGFYIFILPDGRYELTSTISHRTRYERDLDAEPLTKQELRAKST